MRRRCLNLLLAIGLVALLGPQGCSSGPSVPGDVDRRTALIQDVTAEMEALVNARPDATPEDLRALLVARPELVETGVEPEGAWGRFADGRLFYLLDDRVPSAAFAAGAPSTQSATTPDMPPYELPTSDRVLLIDTMGNLFTPYWKDLDRWFTGASYLTTFRIGTVEELKNVSGQAVVYVDSHGGRSVNKYTRLFIDESRVYIPCIAAILRRLGTGCPEEFDVREGQRLSHSIKGMALYEEQPGIAALAWAMERGFEKLAVDGTDAALVRGLAAAVPMLARMIDDVEEHGVPGVNPEARVEAIEAAL